MANILGSDKGGMTIKYHNSGQQQEKTNGLLSEASNVNVVLGRVDSCACECCVSGTPWVVTHHRELWVIDGEVHNVNPTDIPGHFDRSRSEGRQHQFMPPPAGQGAHAHATHVHAAAHAA